mmetsp:Transcript_16338/g.24420  ORF Transcript_16338/g.24420 Transcript_16338/m.24420 type:complete len:893 (-) Transcript_16338:209-2887(-)
MAKKKGKKSSSNNKTKRETTSAFAKSMDEKMKKIHEEFKDLTTYEDAIASSTNPLCLAMIELKNSAEKFDLTELAYYLADPVCSLARDDFTHLKAQQMHLETITMQKRGRQMTKEELKNSWTEYIDQTSKIFQAYKNKSYALKLAEYSRKNNRVFKTLAPMGKFDYAHMQQSMSGKMISKMKKGNRTSARQLEIQFEAEDPIDNFQRAKEPSYTPLKEKLLNDIKDAEEANDFAKDSFAKKKYWTAEMLWKKAIELDGSVPKYYSNMALVRIRLGRNLRSQIIGYRGLASEFLNKAVADAMTGYEIDPQWERAYQRAAEAYLAIGPYDHAMDACRVLKIAVETIAEPSKNLLALYEKAKNNYRIWCSYMTVPGQPTIPQIIDESIRNLKVAVVRSFAIDGVPAEDIAQAGDAVAEAATAVNAALQMIYLHRSRWEKESEEADTIMNDIQIQLRTIARVLPLPVVAHSKALKSMIFAEKPFTLWGFGKLDRMDVATLKEDFYDPCLNDSEKNNDPMFDEMIARKSGGQQMGLDDFVRTSEMVAGKKAFSYDEDMAPTNFTAFTFSVMQRLLQSKNSPLRAEALERLVELYLVENSNPAWAGGEFMGLCINIAAGTGKYGTPRDPEQMKRVIRSPRGVGMIVKELVNSIGEPGTRFQEALQNISPDEWKLQESKNIHWVVVVYVLPVMDDKLLGAERVDHTGTVTSILSNLFDAFTCVTDFFKSGEVNALDQYMTATAAIVAPMSKSAFGNFVCRKYYSQERTLKDQGKACTNKMIINDLVEIWDGLGMRKRAAYRWEVLPKKTQEELESRGKLAPVSRVDLFKNDGSKVFRDDQGTKLPKKLPECEMCQQREGFGVELFNCTCKLVTYCGKECQKKHWPSHRQVCREARPVKK